ncbi:hypothetical protein BESB_054870 [Besnoitia besnoiti]|uniref:Uncharacterized protein n=1 Tax=Besnoitia besnoiti TaxID=94643 RepID=A0A2A9MIP7_BESBE|nr:hypothetical protein BESB_054870 [Besnoitia besnoiti]PFH35836.1 hypothetical protein BESB_054870 [Besnoitia besnoiti]
MSTKISTAQARHLAEPPTDEPQDRQAIHYTYAEVPARHRTRGNARHPPKTSEDNTLTNPRKQHNGANKPDDGPNLQTHILTYSDYRTAQSAVRSISRDVAAWTGADAESGDSAGAFVDAILAPAGLLVEVAPMMERARDAMTVDGLESPDTADFHQSHLKELLGLVLELEDIVASKIACVEMTKAFFKFVLVPLKLAAPVARMLLDKKPKLLVAFAAKALLMNASGGKAFGDDGMKKLMLLALVAPKALDVLRPNPAGDLLPLLKLLPLLGGAKLDKLLPIALLAMAAFDAPEVAALLKSVVSKKLVSGGYGVEATAVETSDEEMSVVDYLVDSWAVADGQFEDEMTVSRAATEAKEAKSAVKSISRDVAAWTGADAESGDSAGAFVDAILAPAGLLVEVAPMMERARDAMTVDGLESPDTADFHQSHLKELLGLVLELEDIVASKIACVEMTKAFFKFVLVPLKLAAPVARMLLDKKPKLLVAFAAKALLMNASGGKAFGDDGMKKLMLLALVAPKALDVLRTNPAGDLLPLLKLLPLLGGAKLDKLLPIALLAMAAFDAPEVAALLKSVVSKKLVSGGHGVEATAVETSDEEMSVVDYLVDSWAVADGQFEDEMTVSRAATEAKEAKSAVKSISRDVAAWTGADAESGDSAGAFVDAILAPAGLLVEVAPMMERARDAMTVDGLESPDTADFQQSHLKELLGLVLELEDIVASKIACVEMTKAFFKFVLVPLKLAAPVARMLLDKKPKLLLAFAAKALLMNASGGKAFGDDGMKKLMLLALVAPKALDVLRTNPAGDLLPLLKLLPLLGGAKLDKLLPIALLAMAAFDAPEVAALLKSVVSKKLVSGGYGVEATAVETSDEEMSVVDYLVDSWAVADGQFEDEMTVSRAATEAKEAKSAVKSISRDVAAWTGADAESGDSAGAFVDAILAPAGLLVEVAPMMERARDAMTVDGLESPDTADFHQSHLKELLGLVLELEDIVASKIACVEMTKAFFKFVLVPLKLAAPVARMLLDKKPKLLLAFAAKALLMNASGGKAFGDDGMKKLMLLALVAPKALDVLRTNPAGDLLPLLKLLPLLGGAKLDKLLPIALLAMAAFDAPEVAALLKSVVSKKLVSGGYGVEATAVETSDEEMSVVDYLVDSWAVADGQFEDEMTVSRAATEAKEAKSAVKSISRDVAAWTGADAESGDSAGAFVDAILAPAGLLVEVAPMMERARDAMTVDGLESPDTADFQQSHLKELLGLVLELEDIVASKIACVEMTKAFFKFVLVPLKLAAPVARMLLDKKPKLLLAFAAKALLMNASGGKAFGDDGMKKLMLLALVAPKALDVLRTNPAGDLLPLLKLLPLLGGAKLDKLLPIALLAMAAFDAPEVAALLKSVVSKKLVSGGYGVKATAVETSDEEMSVVDYLVDSWAVADGQFEDEMTVSRAATEAKEAKSAVKSISRDVAAWTGADAESGDSAGAFVDAILAPAGLLVEVAPMMERARDAMTVDGLESPDTADFHQSHLKELLGLVLELEDIVASKIACVEMTKAFFKFVLVPLKLAAPVARMLLDKKPKLLLAFAAKALLMNASGGKAFGDDGMKKLMLLALVAPKALDVLRTNPAGDLLPLLKLLPLLGGAKLDKLLPIALLAMAAFDAPEVAALLKSVVSKKLVSGGYGVEATAVETSDEEMSVVDYLVDSWAVADGQFEDEMTVSRAATEAKEAKSAVKSISRDVAAWTGADAESGDSAGAFVDAILAPAGLLVEVAPMMERARDAMTVDGLESPDTADFHQSHLKELLGLVLELEDIVASKIACVEMTKAFFKFVLVPLKLAAPVARMLLDKKPKLLLAFAAKALLMNASGGKAFGDDGMKKLMLLALVAPKALDVLRTNPAGDLLPLLKLLPLLGGAKLDKLLPIALLAMAAFDAPEVAALLKSVVSKKLVSGGYGVEATAVETSDEEMSVVDYLVDSWAVADGQFEDEMTVSRAATEAKEAKSAVKSISRDVAAWTGADAESGDSAGAFVDAILAPAGLLVEVAPMMERARDAMTVDGLESPDTADFHQSHLKELLGLVLELEDIVASKIACVEMTKAFFKFVLVPLKLAAPVARMLLDKKPKLLLAFAAKALLMNASGGKAFGDDGMKKLMLLALVAPKALDVLRTNPAGDLLPLLKLLPLLGGAKLDKLLPIALLAMAAFDAPEVAALLKSVVSKKLVSGGYGVEATAVETSDEEMSVVDYLVDSWAVADGQFEDEMTVSRAATEAKEAKSAVKSISRDVAAWTGADAESGDSAGAFVDAILAPAGLLVEVAPMMERARDAMTVDGLESPDTADFHQSHLKELLGLVLELEDIVASKIACVEMTKAFFKFVLVPLKLAAPVARMLLDKKPKLLLAFAAKALLMNASGGKAFGDDGMKKLMLGAKLDKLLPIALLAMAAFDAPEVAALLKSVVSKKLVSGGYGVEATAVETSDEEMSVVDYLVDSWAVADGQFEDEMTVSRAATEAKEAKSAVKSISRDVAAWTGADAESGDSAGAFVDAILAPAGLLVEVAPMMERARDAMTVDGLESPDTADFQQSHLKELLGLVLELEDIVASKIACVEMTKAFFKFVLVPLKLAAPVARMLLDKKPKLLLAFAAKALLMNASGAKPLATTE